MKIVNTLTTKHMLLNKKRTVVTILGIIISVAMFTGVTTFASSFMKMMQVENEKYSGSWQVSYQDVSNDKLELIQKDDNTKNMFSMYYLDSTLLDNKVLPGQPTLDIFTLDQQSFKKNIPLLEGTYPTNELEITIPRYFNGNSEKELKIGDKITVYGGYQDIQYNEETRTFDPNVPGEHASYTYTIVGISDNSFLDYQANNQGYTCYTYTTTNTIANSLSNYNFVELETVSNALYEDSKELASSLSISEDNIQYNSSLVYYGVTTNDTFLEVMYSIVIFVMVIIMIGAVALIYNAFAISLSERSKYLGMIASVGATKHQKRQSVFFEGFCLGIFSIPIGVLCGIGGIAGTFAIINPIMKNLAETDGFPLVISYPGLLLAVGFAIITILISTYIPARRASKISPIEAIRSSKDIKISSKAVKTNKLIKWVFGFEGELAMKNLKRNKKRYYITVISLIVSVILFLSVSGFTYYMKNSFTMSNQSLNYDISIFLHEDNEELVKELQKVKNASEIATVKSTSFSAEIPLDKMNPELISYLKAEDLLKNVVATDNDKYFLQINVLNYDQTYLEDFYQKNNITADENTVVFNKTNVIEENRKFKEISLLDYSKTPLEFPYYNDKGEIDTLTFDAVETTTATPIGNQQTRNYYSVTALVSEKVFQEITTKLGNAGYSGTNLYMNASNQESLDKEITELIKEKDSVYYYNYIAEGQKMDQILFVVNFFMYGFITLISLISIANIFNTITTSVALRTKEFAMLKSVGMTPKSFNKMVYFESLFYGLTTLIIGLPIGLGIMYWMHYTMNSVFGSSFSVPISSFIIVIIAVFMIVGSTLLYSTNKIKKQNIIDGLKEENI